MLVHGETAIRSSGERGRRQFGSSGGLKSAYKRPTPSNPAGQSTQSSIYNPELFGTAIEYYFYPNSSVPVFCPTMEQFKEFEALVAAIEPLAIRGGVCKIIPPKAWRAELERSSETVRVFADEEFPIMKPIVQHFNGSSGMFHQYNVEYHRKVKLAQFFQISQDESHRMPEKRETSEETTKKKKEQEEEMVGSVVESETVGIAVDYKEGKIRLTGAAAEALRNTTRSDALRAKFQAAEASYRPYPDTEGEAAADGSGLKATRSFTRDDGRALFVSAREYSENEELERMYWKNMVFQPPMYGADVLGTLFPEYAEFPYWNIRNLPGLLRQVGQRMPGVNDPYLYLGMWKATFAWHVEDMDLYSINYIHFGAPKAWYSIPIEAHSRFEMSMQNVFANDYKSCSQFLRHKAFLLSPRFLAAQGIPFNRVVQRAGEIILTFPMGYHAGYNHGFNCAESVNFALDRWLDVAWASKHCECVKDSVTIDLMEWFGDQRRERIMARSAKEEAVEEEVVDIEGLGEPQHQGQKRDSPRRHAAAAAAITKNTARNTVKKESGGTKRKQSVSSARRGEPTAKRSPRKAAAKKAEPLAVVEVAGEGADDCGTLARRYASLHTPVGACGGCLRPIAGFETEAAHVVECAQCGLTVHPQCSGVAYDDGRYRCANCVMDTDQLSCALCAFQNGLLLPVTQEEEGEERRFVHFLCAHFAAETSYEFLGDDSKAEEKQDDDDGVSTRAQAAARVAAAAKQALVARERVPMTKPIGMKRSARQQDSDVIMESSARVSGVDAISRGRYAGGRCQFCHNHVPTLVQQQQQQQQPRQCFGPVVQCAHARCFRSLHPMCAAVHQPELLDWVQAKAYCGRNHLPC